MQEDTIFRIYSMTKPITSIALMTLYEEGRFQLNDPVHRFLPAWRDHEVWVRGEGADMVTRPPASPMTMRHVLSHTSGLTYGALLDADPHPVNSVYQELGVRRSDGETMTSFAEKLSRVPLRFDPGPGGFTPSQQMSAVALSKRFPVRNLKIFCSNEYLSHWA